MIQNHKIKAENRQITKDNKVKIMAVGDIAIGDLLSGYGIKSITQKFGADYPFEHIKSVLAEAELLIGNFEGMATKKACNADLRLAGIPEMGKALKQAGFDVLSVANNHAYDHGPDIFLETVQILKDAGLEVCGLRGKDGFYSEPVILTKKGIKFGILAYNWVGLENVNGIDKYMATVQDGIVNYTWHRNKEANYKAREDILEKNQNVISDVNKLKSLVDFVILLPHWAYEWTIYPPYGVVLEGRHFIDCGVDLILGSHPHVIQAVENYKDGLIAYSLGNFLFEGINTQTEFGMLFTCNVYNKQITNHEINFVRRNKKYQPIPATKDQIEKNKKIVEKSRQAILSDDAQTELDDEYLYKVYETEYYKLKKLSIIYLFLNLPFKPGLLKPIFKKIINAFDIVLMRLRGKRVRW